MRRSSVCNKLADLLSPDCKEYLQHHPWRTHQHILLANPNYPHAIKSCVTWLPWQVWLIIQVHSWRYKPDDKIFRIAHHRIIVLALVLNYHFIPPTPVRRKPGLCCNRVGYNLPEVMVDWVHWKEIWQVMRLTLIVPDVLQNKHSTNIYLHNIILGLASLHGRHPSGALNQIV